ncbi:hypothetical protein C4D60_Mb11t23920 [Musa balbisiana]|uniref:Uncharacterized protein n=1 Tax=Musa balbisiana TaxID=52838 RepID=A0A4S8J8S8_MUSBA|nr:hypothetical protein C4D60_Mb11t23920 [Musa balbisiana]
MVARLGFDGFMSLIFLCRGRFRMTPKGPSLGSLDPNLRRRTTVLSKLGTPSSFSVATNTHPVSGTGIECAHFRPSRWGGSIEAVSLQGVPELIRLGLTLFLLYLQPPSLLIIENSATTEKEEKTTLDITSKREMLNSTPNNPKFIQETTRKIQQQLDIVRLQMTKIAVAYCTGSSLSHFTKQITDKRIKNPNQVVETREKQRLLPEEEWFPWSFFFFPLALTTTDRIPDADELDLLILTLTSIPPERESSPPTTLHPAAAHRSAIKPPLSCFLVAPRTNNPPAVLRLRAHTSMADRRRTVLPRILIILGTRSRINMRQGMTGRGRIRGMAEMGEQSEK